jgi:2-oxoisovalerate dehydrogenase E1 component
MDRVAVVERNLALAIDGAPLARTRLADSAALTATTTLTASAAVALFADQVRSRTLDAVARELKSAGQGYYTISSAGHEDDVVVGAQLRPTDPCLLHYRSGALMMARGRLHGDRDPVHDTLLSLVAAAADPASGGRHKVWGDPDLWVIPQTSTIASHLPKAVGLAFALDRPANTTLPADAIVCCSFGDASVNHAAALAAVNAARWARRQGRGMPVLFLCEDNGLGISVATPPRWIEDTFGGLRHLRYVRADGELDERWDATAHAIDLVRTGRRPVLLHLPTVRLWGHAGSDVETTYRDVARIEADESRDPLVRTAVQLIARGAATRDELRTLVADIRRHVREVADEVTGAPTLATAADVTAPLSATRGPDAVRADATATVPDRRRREVFGGQLPEEATTPVRRTLGAQLNAALKDELLRRPDTVVCGEDVAAKGGVYHVTAGLQSLFGPGRVFDTLLDETTILGVAQGAALAGALPLPEIQYLAYLHNALDQLRGEACSTSFFSAGRYTTPMVVRVASFAYQKGFGGHFHNDNAIGALRDIPGIVVATPSRGDDAVRMLRGCVALAHVDRRVVLFLEPIALYHERDLYAPGDGGWLTDHPRPGSALLPGEVGTYGPVDADVLVVTYANGVRMSLQAARALQDEGIRVRVLDVRWLVPIPTDAIRAEARRCAAVLVADECRETGGGIADAVVASLAEGGYGGRLSSVRSRDSYVPLGPAADAVLLDPAAIAAGVRHLVGSPRLA